MSTKKKANKKGEVKLTVRYGVAVPERDLMNLLRLDCADQIRRFREGLSKPGLIEIANGAKRLKEVFAVAEEVLDVIQNGWKDALLDYAHGEKIPPEICPIECKIAKTPTAAKKAVKKPPLSQEEASKIRALRKLGLSIKAIGKEIHRAEKVVADFVKTLPKK